ncbi:uncharacterized protein LOC109828996 [Asparagus officinalis]|uniref:uncharacterized protein LOC109828996 n=1 Tax=Asparagus officinalis TaxID=4686 RepID=UPI00098E8427|nr:uncharacterized protein LOC109828996 [Asparagus officinalis]
MENPKIRNYKKRQKPRSIKKEESPKRKTKNTNKTPTCYKCKKKGHYANKCLQKDLRTKVNELLLDSKDFTTEEVDRFVNTLNLSDNDSSDHEDLRNNLCTCFNFSESSSETSQLNNLNEHEQFILDTIDAITDSQEKRMQLSKYLEMTKNKGKNLTKVLEEKKDNEYFTFSEIINRIQNEKKIENKVNLEELQKEQGKIRIELLELKQKIKILETYLENKTIEESEGFIETNTFGHEQDNEFINSIEKYVQKKWRCNIMLNIMNEYFVQHTALIDTGADVNCIREDLVPLRFYEKTSHLVSAANGQALKARYKLSNVYICNGGQKIKTSFVLFKDLNQGVILGTSFINSLKPFIVDAHGIHTQAGEPNISFWFNKEPEKMLVNRLFSALEFKEKFINVLSNTEDKDCPDSFNTKILNNKRHIRLSYIKEFSRILFDKRYFNIPVQMDENLLTFCKEEIEKNYQRQFDKR